MAVANKSEHLMLTILGINPRPARYTLGNDEHESELAPVALLELLPVEKQPDRILALCTQKASKDTFPKLEALLADRCAVESVEIPDGTAQADIDKFLNEIASSIPENAALTVDITHGPRHFSILMYVATLYLSALRGVEIRGAYYGLLGQGQGGTSPFIELSPLLELPRWVHALDTLSETGSALPMAELIRQDTHQSAQQIAKDLDALSHAYLAGLPLEQGRSAIKILKEHRRTFGERLVKNRNLPLADQIAKKFRTIIKPRAFVKHDSPKGWKRRISLTENELHRQSSIINSLIADGHTANALGLMEEWTVSWAILRQDSSASWLDYHNVRKKAANRLDAMSAIQKSSDLRQLLSEDQIALGKFWGELKELRNGFAHHGMRGQDLTENSPDVRNIEDVRKYWTETLSQCPDIPLSIGDSPGGSVLVSPIGLRPGVLFSALEACSEGSDDRGVSKCLVICSRDTEASIDEALKHAGYHGKVERLVLEDAFGGGRDEIAHIVKVARKHLISADEVIVNVTGGTTLMGLTAEKIASEARRFARPVRRFGLIDRRTPEQQTEDPYQAGEPFWLDDAEDDYGSKD